MPFYVKLDGRKADDRRAIENILKLRKQLDAEVPRKNMSESVLIATWNIREFDSPSYGDRINEAMYYIAEIIDRFDLVAIQEVREDLKALENLMSILGSNWGFMYTDVTEGTQGNGERMAFLYDTRKVRPTGLASELVLPPIEKKGPDGKKINEAAKQVVRSPFMAGFQAGWTKFILATVHVIYGDSKAEDPERVEEIRQIAQFLKTKSEGEFMRANHLVLLGDFNIFKPTDVTFKAITDAGFIIPAGIQKLPSNAIKDKHYDQMAFKNRDNKFEPLGAGVFDFYKTVFRPEDEAVYAAHMGDAYQKTDDGKPRKDKSLYYKTYWRTFQMSDHLLMWSEVKIDFTEEYLLKKLAPPAAPPA